MILKFVCMFAFIMLFISLRTLLGIYTYVLINNKDKNI